MPRLQDLQTMPLPELFRLWHKLRVLGPEGTPPLKELPRTIRPKSQDFPNTWHGSNSAIDQVLNRIDLKSGKKYLLVFDIDGTLMQAFPNETMFDIDRAGKSPTAVMKVLDDINAMTLPVKSACLTARCNHDFDLVAAFDNIPLYGNFGFAKRKGFGFWEPAESRNTLLPRIFPTVLTMQEVRSYLSSCGVQLGTDFSGDPNSFYFKLRDHNLHLKDTIKQKLLSFLNHGQQDAEKKWSVEESPDGSLLIFINPREPFDKAKGINYVMRDEGVDGDTVVFIFGDSGTDYLAMQEAKRCLGASKVINVGVGPKLADKPGVDYCFRDHIDTRRFIGRLKSKLA